MAVSRSQIFFGFCSAFALAALLLQPLRLSCQTSQAPGAPMGQASGGALAPEAEAQMDQLQSSLQSAIAARDALSASKLLNQIGTIWMRAGNPQNAFNAFSRGVEAAKLAQDVEQGLLALNGAGDAARSLGRQEDALQAHQRALQLATTQNVPAGKASALNGLAQTYASMKQPQKALDFANQALSIRRSLGDKAGEGAILAEIAIGYSAAGQRQQALDFAQQALAAYQAAGANQGVAATLLGIGDIYASLRDSRAIESYTKAMALARQSNYIRIEAGALNKLGMAANALGKNQEALDDYQQALTIYRRLNMNDAVGTTLNNMAMAYSQLGESSKAFDLYQQALPLLHEAGDRGTEAMALTNTGVLYQQLGDKQKALEMYQQSLSIQDAIGDRADASLTLISIGAAEIQLGQPQLAIEPLNRAIAFQAGAPNERRKAMAQVVLGMAYHKLGNNQKAVESATRGLELLHQLNDLESEAQAEVVLARIAYDTGDLAQTKDRLNEALPLAKSVNDPLLEAPIFYGLMMANKAQPSLAIYFGKEAINLVQQVRTNNQGLNRTLQSTFVSSKADFYHDLADLLIAQGRLKEATQILDLLKQQEYAEYVRGGETAAPSPAPLTVVEQLSDADYQRSTSQLVTIGKQWSDLNSVSPRTDEQEKQFKQLSDRLTAANKGLNDYYARLYVAFGKDSGANKQLTEVKSNVSLLEQQLAESPHTVALYTMMTKDHYRVIVVTGSATLAREFAISDVELNKRITAFQQVLRDPSQDPKPLANELYKILLEPVKADLDQAGAETMVWYLDGSLRYIPMAALFDGKQYVVERYNTVTIAPASLQHLAEKPNVADLSVAAMGVSRKYEDGLSALPGVVGELNDVVKDPHGKGSQGALPGTLLLDSDFTEKALESQLSARHGVIHIASHFVFRPGDDNQSYLLLAGKDEGGTGFHLTVANIRDNRNLDFLHTELLTLSACQTGINGNASDGREIDGLGSTAQLKGAKAVLSSLWSVDDASTGQLMGDFYTRWAGGRGKVSKVEALRQAQLALLLGQRKPRTGAVARGVVVEAKSSDIPLGYAHPYYWAPFVLMGNWR